ncbi:MAG TPA: hypothetical protein ENJ55_01215 [Rhizobiales bacterium]|nr:hypothetical protein [Hyphomicrobiales bacterium]
MTIAPCNHKIGRFFRIGFVGLLALGLAGCGATNNLIDKVTGSKDEVIITGKREAVLPGSGGAAGLAKEPVVVPVAVTNSSWAQPGGVPSNTLQNLSLGRSLKRVFAVSAGTGSTGEGRLTAMPIVVGGRVYVLDSQASVRAFSANSGASVWSVSLVPKGKDSEGAFGGGLASNGNQIFATTAFGEVVALNAASGSEIWRKQFSAPIKTAPTVSNGQVFFVTVANEAYALAAASGAQLWQSSGTGEAASAISNTSPAVASGIVVTPNTNGDITAFAASSGQRYWSQSLASTRAGASVANLNAIAGRPVIAGGQVYGISNAGRMAAFNLKSGLEIWSREFPGNQTPWVSGEYVFVISQKRRMVALERRTGAVKWISDLPGGGIWSGPVMGGGRLLAVSNKGVLASFSPQTGKTINTREAGDAFYIAPVIAGNTVYLLDNDANLLALR